MDFRYWLKGGNAYFVRDTHVRFICDHAGLFGFDAEELQETYRRMKEEYGSDGGGGREIFVGRALQRGWIRLRRYSHCWEFQSTRPEQLLNVRSFLAEIVQRPLGGFQELQDPRTLPVRRTGDVHAVKLAQFLEEAAERVKVYERLP